MIGRGLGYLYCLVCNCPLNKKNDNVPQKYPDVHLCPMHFAEYLRWQDLEATGKGYIIVGYTQVPTDIRFAFRRKPGRPRKEEVPEVKMAPAPPPPPEPKEYTPPPPDEAINEEE